MRTGPAPWRQLYDEDLPATLRPRERSVLELFRAAVARHGERDFVRYLDVRLSFGGADVLSDGLAAGLAPHGDLRDPEQVSRLAAVVRERLGDADL